MRAWPGVPVSNHLMRLLFIKPKHIGDALLLTPTLAAAKATYPEAQIWVVVRRGTEGILAGSPHIDRLLTTAAPESDRRSRWDFLKDLSLLGEIRRQSFDFAFELSHGDRGRLLAAWSGAHFRCASDGVYRLPRFWRPWFNKISTRDWSREHQVEASFHVVREFLPLQIDSPPPLVFSKDRTVPCELGLRAGRYAVLHPGTRWKRKRWPTEHWVVLGQKLRQELDSIVISSGPDPSEMEFCAALAQSIGPGVLCTGGRLSWAQLAGLLYEARLFVGVDTAAMHLAAACQAPTVALFGPSLIEQWHPWRVAYRLLKSNPSQMNSDKNTMIDITPQAALTACGELMSAHAFSPGNGH